MTKSAATEPQRLREENTRLKRLLGQAELEKAAWKEVSEGSLSDQPTAGDTGAPGSTLSNRGMGCTGKRSAACGARKAYGLLPHRKRKRVEGSLMSSRASTSPLGLTASLTLFR